MTSAAREYLDQLISELEKELGLLPGESIAQKKQNTKTPKKKKKKDPAPTTTAVPAQAEITKLDIRVGQIVDVWKHETADKLYCEKIDVGEDSPRNIASGLVKHYSLEQMKVRAVSHQVKTIDDEFYRIDGF